MLVINNLDPHHKIRDMSCLLKYHIFSINELVT